MATILSTRHPGDGIETLNRLRGLAEPLLQIDLDRELQQLRREDSWQRETGRSSKTLAKYPDFRIVLILMKGGTRMRQHRAEGRISIQQLRGQVCIHLANRKVNVSAGQLLVLDCGVLHDVEALEESAFLLTISWRREKSNAAESSSSSQRHFDEEAVSRMDNEGGALETAVNPPGAAVPHTMRKNIITPTRESDQDTDREWLVLDEVASVEVTSEAEDFPVERALTGDGQQGWRADTPGSQTIRLPVRHITENSLHSTGFPGRSFSAHPGVCAALASG